MPFGNPFTGPVRGLDFFLWDLVPGGPDEPALFTRAGVEYEDPRLAYQGRAGSPALILRGNGEAAYANFAQYRRFPYLGYNNQTKKYRPIKWTVDFLMRTASFDLGANVTFALNPEQGLQVRQWFDVFGSKQYQTDINRQLEFVEGTERDYGINGANNPVRLEMIYTPFSKFEVFMTCLPGATYPQGLPRTLKVASSVTDPPPSASSFRPEINCFGCPNNWGIDLLAMRLDYQL